MIPLKRFKTIVEAVVEQKKQNITATVHFSNTAYIIEEEKNYNVSTILALKPDQLYIKRIERNIYEPEPIKALGVEIVGGSHYRTLEYDDNNKNIHFRDSVSWKSMVEMYDDAFIYRIDSIMRLYKDGIANFDNDTLASIIIFFMDVQRTKVNQDEFVKFVDNVKRLDRGYILTNDWLKGWKEWFENNRVMVIPNYSSD